MGQLSGISTFGIKIIVTAGERIGFRYNFKKREGGSYIQKLTTTVNNEMWLVNSNLFLLCGYINDPDNAYPRKTKNAPSSLNTNDDGAFI